MNSLMSRRLTHREVAATLDITPGDLTKIRAKGSRQYDPTLPLPVGGFFIEAEILGWKTARDNRAAQGNTQPISPAIQQQDRRSSIDRRKMS